MTSKLTEHERDLANAKAKLEDIAARRRALAAEEEELVAVVRGWEAIVAMDRREMSGAPMNPPPLSVRAVDSTGVTDLPTTVEVSEEEEEGENKTQFVLDRIQQRASAGTDPTDLRRAAKAAGMAYPSSWPYTPLQRLKKRGEIIKRRGKYYPRPKEVTTTPSSLALVG